MRGEADATSPLLSSPVTTFLGSMIASYCKHMWLFPQVLSLAMGVASSHAQDKPEVPGNWQSQE